MGIHVVGTAKNLYTLKILDLDVYCDINISLNEGCFLFTGKEVSFWFSGSLVNDSSVSDTAPTFVAYV